MENLGKLLIGIGLSVAALGALVWLLQAVFGLKFGRLPGDIAVQRDGFSFFFPITSMVLVSLAATLCVWLFRVVKR